MSRIEAVYRIRAPSAEIERVAQAIALEQSVEVPAEAVRDAYVAAEVVGRVGAVTERAPDLFDVHIGLAEVTAGGDVAQTVNMLFGNSSLHATCRARRRRLSRTRSRARFGGPRHGVAGLRAAARRERPAADLRGAQAAGPCARRNSRSSARRSRAPASTSSRTTTGSPTSPTRRSPSARCLCQRAIERARAKRAGACFTPPASSVARGPWSSGAKIVREEGIGMVLLAPDADRHAGVPSSSSREHLDVPVLAHPAYAGATRVAPPLLLGKLFRMLGADAMIYPNYGRALLILRGAVPRSRRRDARRRCMRCRPRCLSLPAA